MNTEGRHIHVAGLRVHVVRKAIKNLHLGVYPPSGRVRIAAPLSVSDDSVRLAVAGKIGWIKRQRSRFQNQPRQSQREMVSGESHYFLGRRYRLRVIPHHGPGKVTLRGKSRIELHVSHKSSRPDRARTLNRWYRQEIRKLIPPLLQEWQSRLGVDVAEWRIKLMKTKWGACNIEARRVWLNLELAKKPIACLEYIIVHELMHFLERHHNDRFIALMDRHLPQWRSLRQELNSAPLGHASWDY